MIRQFFVDRLITVCADLFIVQDIIDAERRERSGIRFTKTIAAHSVGILQSFGDR